MSSGYGAGLPHEFRYRHLEAVQLALLFVRRRVEGVIWRPAGAGRLLDHRVGASEQQVRDMQTQLPRRLEIDLAILDPVTK